MIALYDYLYTDKKKPDKWFKSLNYLQKLKLNIVYLKWRDERRHCLVHRRINAVLTVQKHDASRHGVSANWVAHAIAWYRGSKHKVYKQIPLNRAFFFSSQRTHNLLDLSTIC